MAEVGDLVKNITDDVKVIVRSEVQLAKSELSSSAKNADGPHDQQRRGKGQHSFEPAATQIGNKEPGKHPGSQQCHPFGEWFRLAGDLVKLCLSLRLRDFTGRYVRHEPVQCSQPGKVLAP